MSILSDYDKAFKTWEKLEPKPIELTFKCSDKGWEDGRIVFRIATDGIGVRDFYRFKRELGGEIEAVSSSKKGRMTVRNWKSKGLEDRYTAKFSKWIEDVLVTGKHLQYAEAYKAWSKAQPKDIKVGFVNKEGHKYEIEYYEGGTFVGQDRTEWDQNLYIGIKAFRNFLNGKTKDEQAEEAINTPEALQKVKKWFERISA